MSSREMLDSRRKLLKGAGALAASWLTLPHARLLRAQTAEVETVTLGDGLVALIGPNGNAVAADSSEGVVMVDGGHASWSGRLLETIDAYFGGRPVRALFNTHWHTEQTGSNAALGERGAQIIAHENTRLWLGTEVWVRWSDIRYPPLPEVARPVTSFLDSGSMRFGDRELGYGYMRNAHTDGDIWVLFPDENVLAVGGAVSNDGWPVIDWWTGGWLGGMLDGFDALLEIANENTRIVPGNGPVMSLADLRAQHEMYLTIFDRLQTMLRQAFGTDEVLAAAPTAEYDGRWGNPEQFLTLAFESLWGHLRDAHDTRLRNIP